MQLIIPMSGIGQRFIDAGYKTPKPLLEIESKAIIHHVYKMFPGIESGLKVIYFEIDFYLCWGTPNDLKTYNYWQNCFHKWENHPYRKELDDDFL